MKLNKYFLPLIIIAFAFFIIGFGVGINGIMVPILEQTFSLSKGMSYLVLTATFSAFLLFGGPSGWVVRKIGYKKSLIIALFIMSLGMLLFIPSAKMSSSMAGFYLFLTASFIGGIGNTLLQTTINPYIAIIEPVERAAQRMCLMGIMNQSAWFLGPIFLSLFIDVRNPVLANAAIPFGMAAGIIGLFALAMIFIPLPEITAEGEDEQDENNLENELVIAANRKKSVWQFPHLLLGVFALFLYVGVETLPMASVIDFARSTGVDSPARYSMIGPVGMIIGYIISIFVLQWLSQSKALILFSLIALTSSVLLVTLPPHIAIYFLSGLGFSHSIMWGCIWGLTITSMGKFTKSGASMLIVALVGGAAIPLTFGVLLDLIKTSDVTTPSDFQTVYRIFIPCYLYIFFYAFIGHKIGRKIAKS
ncbi:MFS transporter [uncultured Proteiniphilum sp.]|uniref:MFS transporter n=1 Tax=uncultured Proteiniphilum sp. TaxID=497637 RepID=UPI00261DF2A3|nr:MFS transporter [uncultured Proteiniphilum sp.]